MNQRVFNPTTHAMSGTSRGCGENHCPGLFKKGSDLSVAKSGGQHDHDRSHYFQSWHASHVLRPTSRCFDRIDDDFPRRVPVNQNDHQRKLWTYMICQQHFCSQDIKDEFPCTFGAVRTKPLASFSHARRYHARSHATGNRGDLCTLQTA